MRQDFFDKVIDCSVLLLVILGIVCVIGITISYCGRFSNEKTLILEQSLNEQIQEKQVYINILERSSNGKIIL